MAALVRYIRESIEGLSAGHLPDRCPFTVVGAAGPVGGSPRTMTGG